MPRALIVAATSLAALLSLAAPASAAAPEPQKPVDPAAIVGRWYEVARIHNKLQLDCEGSTFDFTAAGPKRFVLSQTCHKGSADGPAVVHRGNARVIDEQNNAKIRVAFLGGFMQKDYWVIDHAADNSWALLGTPDGRFMWLLARRPALPERAQVLARAKTLGFDLSRIEYAKQPPA